MKFGGKILICVVGGFALSVGAETARDTLEGPYRGIVERNVFNLKPPPPAVPPEPPPTPPPKVTLTGITTILGNKKALMKVALPPKPPDPAKEESRILAEGQGEAEIEVLQIDEKAGSVKINNHGTIQTLDFKNDGAKYVNVPMLPPPPGAGGLPQPMGIPPPVQPPNPASSTMRTIPTRTMRLPNGTGTPQSSAMPGAVPAGFGGGEGQPGYVGNGVQPQNQSTLTPEEQQLMIEALRQQAIQQGNATKARILPPTRLGQQLNGGAQPPVPPQ